MWDWSDALVSGNIDGNQVAESHDEAAQKKHHEEA